MSAAADVARVTFPAAHGFARIGRVTASGLALRLGFDVGRVENLRLAVDLAVRALEGPDTISMQASWDPDHLVLTIETANGPVDSAAVVADIGDLVDEVRPTPLGFELRLG